MPADLLREGADALLPLSGPQGHADDRLQPAAEAALIDGGVEPGEESAVDESAHPGVGGGCRDPERVGEGGVRHPGVGGEQFDDAGIERVEVVVGHRRSFGSEIG